MALVITRRLREGFWVGDSHVLITRIGESSIKIAIEAPPNVRILRGELKPFTDPPLDDAEETSPE